MKKKMTRTPEVKVGTKDREKNKRKRMTPPHNKGRH